MKALLRRLTGLLVVLQFTASLYAQDASQTDSIQLVREFQQQTDKWKQAYNGGDAQQLAPLYTKDAVYISAHVPGLVAEGRDKLTAYFQNGMNMGGHIDTIEVVSLNISCSLATLHCKYQATNSGVTVAGRNVLVLKRVNDAWLIVLHMTVVN